MELCGFTLISAGDLVETYLPAWEGCILGGGAHSIMCAYNSGELFLSDMGPLLILLSSEWYSKLRQWLPAHRHSARGVGVGWIRHQRLRGNHVHRDYSVRVALHSSPLHSNPPRHLLLLSSPL